MGYILLATGVLLTLAVFSAALGFGIYNYRIIRNDKLVVSIIIPLLGGCTILWTIWIAYAIGFWCYKTYYFLSTLL